MDRFVEHFELLLRWNRKINLTRIVDEADAAIRHYGESAVLARWLPPNAGGIADLGSGGGFPGIPIAVLRPELQITLIEAHQRKAAFLREAVRDLPNARVLAVRGEAVQERFGWVVSRAVSWKELRRFVFGLTAEVALLTREEEVEAEKERIALPWPGSGALVHVSRET